MLRKREVLLNAAFVSFVTLVSDWKQILHRSYWSSIMYGISLWYLFLWSY